jgi:uncharacterized protein (TIGR02217 family)
MTIPFHEVRFPEGIAEAQGSGGPTFSTTISELASGKEQRNVNWRRALAQYDVAHQIKDRQQTWQLMDFFFARQGMRYGFRFKDWSDYQATGQGLLAWSAGFPGWFNLIKVYGTARTYVRPITKPVPDTVKLYSDGNLLGPLSCGVDYTSGLVHVYDSGLLSTTLTTTFEFDVPVRFNVDKMDATLNSFSNNTWDSIRLVEIRI